MAVINNVLIVSDRQEVIGYISQNLVLLRNCDKVDSCSIEEAHNVLDGYCPNVLILHCDNNNNRILALIKKIRKQDIYKNLPILFINENCSRETVLEAFDLGITDILFMPIIDYELLIRVIWCLKRNDINFINESRKNFLLNIGVLQADTGVYVQKYCDECLKNEIALTRKFSQRACILLVSTDKKINNLGKPIDFINVLKNSVRSVDSIIIKDENQFYLYLQKTKLNGAYSVFERINNALGVDFSANAGVVEVHEQSFEDIKNGLDDALAKANESSNSLIVASDFYASKNSIPIDIDLSMDIAKNELEAAKDYKQTKSNDNRFDKNSLRLFNQAYTRKLKVVISPVFKKYETKIREKSQDFVINSYTGNKSIFSISRGDVTASMYIEYNGVEHITVCLSIIDGNQKKLFETETIDFTILDYRKVAIMLSELINKFLSYCDKKNKNHSIIEN